MSERHGGCQCGRVRYRIAAEKMMLVVCHCKECQRQSGSAFGMSLIVSLGAFSVEGELKMFERPANSGRSVRCFFCPECGTRIYHQSSAALGLANVKAGTLDDTSWLEPQLHVWVDSKQPWVHIPPHLPTYSTQP